MIKLNTENSLNTETSNELEFFKPILYTNTKITLKFLDLFNSWDFSNKNLRSLIREANEKFLKSIPKK